MHFWVCMGARGLMSAPIAAEPSYRPYNLPLRAISCAGRFDVVDEPTREYP